MSEWVWPAKSKSTTSRSMGVLHASNRWSNQFWLFIIPVGRGFKPVYKRLIRPVFHDGGFLV